MPAVWGHRAVMTDRWGLRWALAVLVLALLILGGRDLGRRAHGGEVTLNECLAEGDVPCLERRFNLGGLRSEGLPVDGARSVVLVSGVEIELHGWPDDVPEPGSGVVFAVIGRYLGNHRFAVQDAELYPLHGMDMVVGVLVVGIWLVAVLVATRRGYDDDPDPSEHG